MTTQRYIVIIDPEQTNICIMRTESTRQIIVSCDCLGSNCQGRVRTNTMLTWEEVYLMAKSYSKQSERMKSKPQIMNDQLLVRIEQIRLGLPRVRCMSQSSNVFTFRFLFARSLHILIMWYKPEFVFRQQACMNVSFIYSCNRAFLMSDLCQRPCTIDLKLLWFMEKHVWIQHLRDEPSTKPNQTLASKGWS